MGDVQVSDLVKDLDLTKYDVRSVAQDLGKIANLPQAIAATAGRAAAVPLVVMVATWLVFTSRMATWALVPFVGAAGFLSMGVAAVVAVTLFTRRQVDACTDASRRVLSVVSEMHTDLALLRTGAAQLTVRSTAATLSDEVVFPMVEEIGIGFASTFLRGPLRPVARAVVGVPVGVVKKSVAAAIDRLPIDALDAAVTLGDDETDTTVDTLGSVGAAVTELDSRYTAIQASIEQIVTGVAKRSVAPMLVAVVATAVPLVLWWAIGLALS